MNSVHKWSLRSLLGVELSPVSHREKFLSMAGGLVSIWVLIWLTQGILHLSGAVALIASMGASAVLLFAVPHGQLSQPWPVIAGHGFSALIGVLCQNWIPDSSVAAALAVALSIWVMHQLKCIHPPGGATALTAVLGGPAIHDLGFEFVLHPVLINAVLMVAIAVLFNAAFGWRRYPAVLGARRLPEAGGSATHGEIVTALQSLDTFVDVSEQDLALLNRLLDELHRNPASSLSQSDARS